MKTKSIKNETKNPVEKYLQDNAARVNLDETVQKRLINFIKERYKEAENKFIQDLYVQIDEYGERINELRLSYVENINKMFAPVTMDEYHLMSLDSPEIQELRNLINLCNKHADQNREAFKETYRLVYQRAILNKTTDTDMEFIQKFF